MNEQEPDAEKKAGDGHTKTLVGTTKMDFIYEATEQTKVVLT